MFGSKRFRQLALLLVALTAFAVLAPGFTGPFVLDDFSNIANNQALHPDDWDGDAVWRAVVTNSSGPLGRPVSMLSFALNAMTTGISPAPMKLTNAVLHSITAVLAGLLILRLFGVANVSLDERQRVLAALLATACWALHPLAITSTLYVVQRMNLLAVLFTIAALLAYLRARPWFFRSPLRAAAWMAFALLLWILGVFSKESAVLMPLYALLIEWLVFAFRDDQGREQPSWRRLVLGSAAVAAAISAVIICLKWAQWTGGFDLRPFSIGERLLTEARVIWRYIGMILLPSHSRLGLFLDDIPLSTGLLSPWTTMLSVAGLVAWVTGAVWLRKCAPLVSFGMLFFIAGHLLESTFIPLEIAFEHRNYLPALGLMIALAASVLQIANRLKARVLEWLPLGALAVFLAFFTVIRSVHWSDTFMLAQLEAYHHPQSARAHAQLGFVYTQFARRMPEDSGWPAFYMDAAAEHFGTATKLDENTVVPLILWYLHSRAHERPFPQEAYKELLERLHRGLPTAATPGSLDMLFECVMEGCGVSSADLETLLRVTLENPRVTGRNRSETLVVAAKYFQHIKGDVASAISLLAQAVEASPRNPRFRLYLARQLLYSGNIKAAKEQIARAQVIDEWGAYDEDVAELLNIIENSNMTSREAGSDAQKTFSHPPRQERG